MSGRGQYDLGTVQKKALKLKGDSGKVQKSKKKKKKKKVQDLALTSKNAANHDEEDAGSSTNQKASSMTKAEKKFKERQEKDKMDRILKRASTTHRDRVEEFNRHLDSLSEHYDIPKVSWTK